MTLKRFYVLDEEGAPVNEPDFLKWATWFEASRAKCRVARDKFEGGYVSTVFLGIDHNWGVGRSGPLRDDDLRRRPRR